MITQIKKGEDCILRVGFMYPGTNTIVDLRGYQELDATLIQPNGISKKVVCKFDEVINKVVVRLTDEDIASIGVYGFTITATKYRRVISTPISNIIEVCNVVDSLIKNVNLYFDAIILENPDNVVLTGASPKISETHTWLVYNDALNAYEDTGINVGSGLTDSQKQWLGEGLSLGNGAKSLPEGINKNTEELKKKALKDHTHDYAPSYHTHDYSPSNHDHNLDYAPNSHTHTDLLKKPDTDGSAGQVLTKTANGTEWKTPVFGDGSAPGFGGLTEAQKTFLGASGDLQTEAKNSLPSAINEVSAKVETFEQELVNKEVTQLINNGKYNEEISVGLNGKIVTKLGMLHRTAGYSGIFKPEWAKVEEIDSIYIYSSVYMTHWAMDIKSTLKKIGLISVKAGVEVSSSICAWMSNVEYIRWTPSCIRVKAGEQLNYASFGAKFTDESIASMIDGLDTITNNSSVILTKNIVDRLSVEQKNNITNKGWTIIQQ